MTMPGDIGAIDLMISFPVVERARRPTTTCGDDARTGRRGDRWSSRRATCSRTSRTSSTRATTASTSRIAEMDKWGVDMGLVGVGTADQAGAGGATPVASSPASRSTPTTSPARCARSASTKEEYDIKARHDVPGRLQPAGAGRRPPLLPDLPDVHRPRHPDHLQRGHRRTALPVGVPGRHALRPGLLRLPRAAHRDAPRRRAVGGARGEADAQVAGPLLHAERVRAQVLPRRRSSSTPTRAAPTR